MKPLLRHRPAQATVGALALAILASPPMRELLEAGMWRHMLLQYPLLLACGALLARAAPPALSRQLARWDALGLTGLAASALAAGVLMIPRVLDLALVDARVEAAKFATLLVVGSALRPSWRRAGPVVQAFFVGGVLPMTIAVGTLYQDSPLRLCNAYLLEDQQALGRHLVGLAVAAALGWLVRTARVFIASERKPATTG